MLLYYADKACTKTDNSPPCAFLYSSIAIKEEIEIIKPIPHQFCSMITIMGKKKKLQKLFRTQQKINVATICVWSIKH